MQYVHSVYYTEFFSRVLTRVECYNPKTNCLFYVKSLPEPRAEAPVTIGNGRIHLSWGTTLYMMVMYQTSWIPWISVGEFIKHWGCQQVMLNTVSVFISDSFEC